MAEELTRSVAAMSVSSGSHGDSGLGPSVPSGSASNSSGRSFGKFEIAARPAMPEKKHPAVVGSKPLVSNFLKLSLNKQYAGQIIHQYSVRIRKPDRTGRDFDDVIKREMCTPVFWRCVNDNPDVFVEKQYIVYNDVNIFYTSRQPKLRDGIQEFRIMDTRGTLKYLIEIKATSGFIFDLENQETGVFLDALLTQAVRLVDSPTSFVAYGHSIFHVPQNAAEGREFTIPLPGSVEALIGLHMGLRPNLQAGTLLNVDISSSVFKKRSKNLVDYVAEICTRDPSRPINMKTITFGQYERKDINSFLKGLLVRTTYNLANGRPNTKKFLQLGDKAASAATFDIDDGNRTITVEQYYMETYNLELKYPNLPVVLLAPKARSIMVPMEFLMTVDEPQKHKGNLTEQQKAAFIREAGSVTPAQRLGKITGLLTRKGLNDAYTENYGVELDENFVEVNAEKIVTPKLIMGQNEVVTPGVKDDWELCNQRSLRQFFSTSKQSAVFSVVHVGQARWTPDMMNRLLNLEKTLKGFGVNVVGSGREPYEKMHWDPQFHRLRRGDGINDQYDQLDKFLVHVKSSVAEDARKHKIDAVPIVLFIMPNKHQFTYDTIKFACDIHRGVCSQVILQKNLDRIFPNLNCATGQNVCLKVNAKLGGEGYRIAATSEGGNFGIWSRFVNKSEPVLVIGVDVTHPSPLERMEMKNNPKTSFYPSVASVVGSINLQATLYSTSTKVQLPNQETVVYMVEPLQERIIEFTDKVGTRPAHIVIYRDGVSDSELLKVMEEELTSVRAACTKLDEKYEPTLTYIVCQKRHHCRFFNCRADNLKAAEQIPPGVVVQNGVVSKEYFDFFLASHFGALGTTRPVRYLVLHDTWCPSAYMWQTVTYALAHLYARCPKSVSLPAPAYYAHLAAKRSRGHLNVLKKLVDMYRWTPDEMAAEFQRNLRIHNDIPGMYFC